MEEAIATATIVATTIIIQAMVDMKTVVEATTVEVVETTTEEAVDTKMEEVVATTMVVILNSHLNRLRPGQKTDRRWEQQHREQQQQLKDSLGQSLDAEMSI